MNSKLKKLPVGIYTLKQIIEENYLYIDKTEIALNLIENNKYVFLSRPRRFGKSLFLDTLKNIFEGNKELFKGLYIYDKYEFKKYPVIKISFANGSIRNREELDDRIFKILKLNQKNLDITCEFPTDVAGCFSELIIEANKKYKNKVVILVDEYDKPILDNITNKEMASEIREGLRNLYSVIKGSDEYLRFAFLTGVSKFTKTSIFSGLNNITDITLNPEYGNICGYTQNDIESSFLPYLDNVDLDKLKEWYDGYNFLKDNVYNPYNILLFIQNGKRYKNYWFESGTPTFLINWIKENGVNIKSFENIRVGYDFFNSFDIDDLDITSLMFQSGYLTIKKYNPDREQYFLSYPNREVKESFINRLFRLFSNKPASQTSDIIWQLEDALLDNDIELFIEKLKSTFTSIPYQIFIKEKESYYQSIIYIVMRLIGFNIKAEESISKGRSDAIVFTDSHIYIFGFKMFPVTAKDAITQIKNKGYEKPYLTDKREKVLIGVSFKADDKNIFEYDLEVV